MTVKVRQLVRVSSGQFPPIPPVPSITMAFVEQPTDTEVNQPFSPPISVQISDGAPDLLILTNFSGTCNLPFQYAQADANGLATFTGFSAGPFTSGEVGCMVSVTNLTRPEVPTIISNTFHVTEAPPVSRIEIVNNGTAIGVGQSPNGDSLTVRNQINGALLDTTGADFWLFFAETALIDELNRIRPFVFDAFRDFVMIATFPDLFSSVSRMFSDYCIPFITGSDSGWTLRQPGYPGPTPVPNSAPASVSFALSGVNAANPITAAARGTSEGAASPSEMSVRLPSPLPVNRTDCFVVTFIGGVLNDLITAPYPNSFFLPVIGGVAWGIGVSWKFNSNLIEDPVWIVDGLLSINVCVVAVTPA